jgi:hypothetical protein
MAYLQRVKKGVVREGRKQVSELKKFVREQNKELKATIKKEKTSVKRLHKSFFKGGK